MGYANLKVDKDLYDWLKSLDNSPNKALRMLMDKRAVPEPQKEDTFKLTNHECRLDSLEEQLNKLQTILEKIINLNKLYH